MRQITAQDGLNGSVVTSIHQAANGMLLVGTLDGLNLIYGGRAIRPRYIHSFEGEIIERIVGTANNDLWIHTTHGLHKLGIEECPMLSFPQFTGLYITRAAGPDRVAVFDAQSKLQIYNAQTEKFVQVDYPLAPGDQIIDMGGTEDFFWTVTRTGIFRHTWTRTTDNRISLSPPKQMVSTPIIYSTVATDRRSVFYVDGEKRLHQLEISGGRNTQILQMGSETDSRGTPWGIVENKGSYFVSFKVNGILKYDYDTHTKQWKHTDLGIKSGVWQIAKDRFQNLIWIATDGQGLFTTKDDTYTFRSVCYSDFNHNLGKPVRALFLDKDEWLWVGTKGEGLLGIDRSDNGKALYDCKQHLFTSDNSPLKDNSVYALSKSTHGGFWIGTEEGLNFFRYADRSVQRVPGSENIIYVHSIQECGDSVLWIATVGAGVFKARIHKHGGGVELKDVEQYKWGDGKTSSNYFFAMHHTTGGDIWLGNRGYGVFRMKPNGPEQLPPTSKQHSYLLNDVFALQEYNGVMWAGTGGGLTGFGRNGEEYYVNSESGLPNNIIHSLLADDQQGMWIATNNGLARLDSTFTKIKNYDTEDGLRVTEFSDGAAFRTDDKLYFGGVNGWLEISYNPNYTKPDAYKAPLQFLQFWGTDKHINLSPLYSSLPQGQEEIKVELTQDKNDFTISYVATDHINAKDYRYKYKMESDKKGEWIDNGAQTRISFMNLEPGRYTLHLKYYNLTTGTESEPIHMRLTIKPHWWNTPLMKIFYQLLLVCVVIYLITLKYRKIKRRHYYAMKVLEQKHKEELYEEKLRFFTNVTHEFSTPLTLIFTPCERILSHSGSDDFVRKYVLLIRKHATRLHQLVQEMIDYRRIETGHQKLNIRNCDFSDFMTESCDIFTDAAEKKHIDFRTEIEPGIHWNTDMRIVPNVVGNILSNAIKYTPDGGTIRVRFAKLSEEKIEIRIYNTGNGIREEDKQHIFNRYSLLDNVGNTDPNVARNGLGMAICHSSVKLLGGEIEIESEVGSYTEFIVTLPQLTPLENDPQAETEEPMSLALQGMKKNRQEWESPAGEQETLPVTIDEKKDKPAVLAVDDNPDVLFLLNEVLSPFYRISTARNAEEALELLCKEPPRLIITDVMMPGTDGIQLTKRIKENKHTMHIPLIILSAKNTEEYKTEGIQTGADAYIGKPFNTQYLLAVVKQLIESRKGMEEYYNTSASAFEYMDGKLLKKEDKEFIRKFNKYIMANLSDPALNKEDMAEAMNTSVRSLYRHFKELDLPSPKDYLRDIRMNHVAKLLLTTDKSVQEIIYACGFNNRTHFYKEFGQRFGMTPKEFRQQKKKDKDLLQ